MQMMKDYANPILLLAVVILMASRAFAPSEALRDTLDMWLLAICATGMLVDGALALARALSRRPSLMCVVWSVSFLMLGCCTWAMRAMPVSEDEAAYQQLSQGEGMQDPLARDDEGETLFSRAAALGKVDAMRRILSEAHPGEAHLNEAGRRAAEGNQVEALELLAAAGMSARASVEGTPLLHSAAQNGCCEAMEWLIMRGAQTDVRDDEGSTPLIQATLSGSAAAVKLLLEKGANPKLRDATGKSPADYARSAEIADLLTPPAPPAP